MKLNLSKIFNIKPNGGGYKTLKKLMGKYNIPVDEIKDIKKELNKESSNGDSGGVKEYYYKVLDNIFDDGPIGQILSTYTIESLIVTIEVYGNYTIIEDVNISFYNITSGIAKPNGNPKAIKLLDNLNGYWDYLDWAANSKPNQYIKVPKGNIITKLLSMATENTTEEEINQMIEYVNSYVQEITKEEYEAMITYKPE